MYFYSVIQKTASLFIFIGAAIYPFHSVPLYDKLLCLHIMTDSCIVVLKCKINHIFTSGKFARLGKGKLDSIMNSI